MPLVRASAVVALLLFLQLVRTYGSTPGAPLQPAAPDMQALAISVRDTLLREYREEPRFTYVEKRRDVEVSKLGKVYVGPLRTFEVYPRTFGPDYKRLIEIEGKALDPAELARRDEEHRRNEAKRLERERLEPPQKRAARLKKEQDEMEATVKDAASVFALVYAGRETVDGEPMIVATLQPRQDARVTTREGEWMKKFTGRMWIAESDHHIARLQLRAVDDVSIGWGVVARVESGSGFEYVRKRIGGYWVPLELTVEGSGRTLLFRRFSVKTVTTYSNHQRWDPTSATLR